MKKLICLLLLVGCGDVATSDVSVDQEQDNLVAVNQEELNCNTACTVSPSGDGQLVTAVKECEGSGPLVVAVQAFKECDSINELTGDAGESLEGEG